MSYKFRLSVIIPVHNEETVLPELLLRLRRVLATIQGGPHEVIFVDDGSIDGSLSILEQEARTDPQIVVLSLSRNFGHQASLTAGLDHATGEAVVIMDADLQDRPEAIPEFIKFYEQGYDVVYARRVRRKEPLSLRACYFLFYRMMAALSDLQLPLDAGDFGLVSRRVVEHLRNMPEHHRYLRGLRSWVGFRQIGIDVERDERHSGRSKYGPFRLIRLASDAVFAFSIIPIRAAALLGTAAIAFSLLFGMYSLYMKFVRSQTPQGFTALVFLLTFLCGILLLFLGIIGEYVGRVYEEVKRRPPYIIDRIFVSGVAGSPAHLQSKRLMDSEKYGSHSTV